MTVIELILSLVAILAAAALFTNAIEILGERLNLGHGAVGSVLVSGGLVYYMLRQGKPVQVPYLIAGGVLYGVFVVAAVTVVFI